MQKFAEMEGENNLNYGAAAYIRSNKKKIRKYINFFWNKSRICSFSVFALSQNLLSCSSIHLLKKTRTDLLITRGRS